MTMFRRTSVTAVTAASAVAAFLLAGCTGQPAGDSDGGESPASGSVTLVTHDSFTLSDGILDQFTEESGLTVQVNAAGDAGTLANQLVLTKDAPLGDAVFGIDNTFASRVTEAGVIAGDLAQIDRGDVCVNADKEWFAEQDLAIPESLDDLADPEYQGLLAVTNPATSSPGLAFLLATYGAFGDEGFRDYWEKLRENDVKIVDSWEDAYFVDFSGADGEGEHPLVLSYATSPAYTVNDDGESTTTALLDTCFRQKEYAGVLAGADNPEGAAELVQFLQSDVVQEDLPGSMYMYPADENTALPEDWVKHAPLADDPYEVAPEDIAAHRDEWIEAWTAIVLG